jgi:hypothetical protein
MYIYICESVRVCECVYFQAICGFICGVHLIFLPLSLPITSTCNLPLTTCRLVFKKGSDSGIGTRQLCGMRVCVYAVCEI